MYIKVWKLRNKNPVPKVGIAVGGAKLKKYITGNYKQVRSLGVGTTTSRYYLLF